MRFDVVLRTFGEFFDREAIRYAVIGGLAIQAWGGSRFTKDADLVVDRESRDRVIAFAESIGYESLAVFESFSNHLNPVDDLGRIDFMYVSGETARKIFSSIERMIVVGDVEAPVVRPEHLAMMKAMSMKNRPMRALYEGEDVRTLLKVPGVDRNEIREYFGRHGLLELFDAIEKAG
jgi:hypothetical protein